MEQKTGVYPINEGFVFLLKDVERKLHGRLIDVEHDEEVIKLTINVADLENMTNLDMPYQEVAIDNTKVL